MPLGRVQCSAAMIGCWISQPRGLFVSVLTEVGPCDVIVTPVWWDILVQLENESLRWVLLLWFSLSFQVLH